LYVGLTRTGATGTGITTGRGTGIAIGVAAGRGTGKVNLGPPLGVVGASGILGTGIGMCSGRGIGTVGVVTFCMVEYIGYVVGQADS